MSIVFFLLYVFLSCCYFFGEYAWIPNTFVWKVVGIRFSCCFFLTNRWWRGSMLLIFHEV